MTNDTKPCCERDNDGDGNCDIHSAPGVLRRPVQVEQPVEHILQFFKHDHLPAPLRMVSRPFCELAHAIVYGDSAVSAGEVVLGGALPRNPERTVALRKLLEAKDAAVRALLAK